MKHFLPLLILLGASAPSFAQTTHQVSVAPGGTFTFSPKNLVIQRGDTVQWNWVSGIHNVNSADGYFRSGAPVAPPMTYSLLFDDAFLNASPISSNRYEYHCELHSGFGMAGSVTVLTSGRPVLTITDPSPGNTVTITVDDATPNGSVIVGYSTHGAGPMSTGFGTALLTPPILRLPTVSAGATGSARLTLTVPGTTPPGLTIWTQALDVAAGVLSNGARVIV